MKMSRIIVLAGVAVMASVSTLATVVCAPARAWDRGAAQAFAHTYDGAAREQTQPKYDNDHDVHCPNFPNLEQSGGDCTNFVSQCLHAHDYKDLGTPDGYGGIKPTNKNGAGLDLYYVIPNTVWYMIWYAGHWWTGGGSGGGQWKLANPFHQFFKSTEPYRSNRVLVTTCDFRHDDDTWGDPPGRWIDAPKVSVVSYDSTWWPDKGPFTCGHLAVTMHHDSTKSDWPGCSSMNPGTVVSEHGIENKAANGHRSHVFWTKADVYKDNPDHRKNWVIAVWYIKADVD